MQPFRNNLALLLLVGVAILGLFFLPPQPVHGPYSRFDLVSFTSYEAVGIPDVIGDNLEVMRMINQLGLARTMEKVAQDSAYEFDDSACHGAAHIVGRMAYALLGGEALQQCTTHCFSGCYHGALQGMGARSGGSVTALSDEIRTLCSAQDTVFERSECFHGAGHGFLLYASYQIDEALGACASFGAEHAHECYAGVFMENVMGDGSEDRFVESDAHYPCTHYEGEVQEACYRLQPSHFLDVFEQDFARATQECLKAPAFAQPVCFTRLGQLSGADTTDPPGNTEAFCATVPREFYDECILGGLRQVIRVNGIDPSGSAAGFCRHLSSPEAKGICYAQYSHELPDLFTDREVRLRLCTLFEDPYQAACREVAG